MCQINIQRTCIGKLRERKEKYNRKLCLAKQELYLIKEKRVKWLINSRNLPA